MGSPESALSMRLFNVRGALAGCESIAAIFKVIRNGGIVSLDERALKVLLNPDAIKKIQENLNRNEGHTFTESEIYQFLQEQLTQNIANTVGDLISPKPEDSLEVMQGSWQRLFALKEPKDPHAPVGIALNEKEVTEWQKSPWIGFIHALFKKRVDLGLSSDIAGECTDLHKVAELLREIKGKKIHEKKVLGSWAVKLPSCPVKIPKGSSIAELINFIGNYSLLRGLKSDSFSETDIKANLEIWGKDISYIDFLNQKLTGKQEFHLPTNKVLESLSKDGINWISTLNNYNQITEKVSKQGVFPILEIDESDGWRAGISSAHRPFQDPLMVAWSNPKYQAKLLNLLGSLGIRFPVEDFSDIPVATHADHELRRWKADWGERIKRWVRKVKNKWFNPGIYKKAAEHRAHRADSENDTAQYLRSVASAHYLYISHTKNSASDSRILQNVEELILKDRQILKTQLAGSSPETLTRYLQWFLAYTWLNSFLEEKRTYERDANNQLQSFTDPLPDKKMVRQSLKRMEADVNVVLCGILRKFDSKEESDD